ncbi:ABC transporter substrate-binding protein [Amycolatopsis antarctica]|uniref:ABC transporter substrate-binding protein n=1 Tax=Amycolatopsis antarctica TaxID=1854586 RepID=A0A263D8K6_9PSEU|nr:glutamate ABC transporter substrate-binding protein [Amycolatopsis antarctica]OZM74721.1 ABC transporter substrate-binding protein [Amycolatopsis antarctica]
MRSKRVALLLAAVLLAGGCGSPGAPVDPAPVGAVERPKPANVGGGEADTGGAGGDDCNATASLAPSGDVAEGSTMDKIRKRGKLVVGVDQNTFLFGFRNPTNGNLEGFDIDMAREVAKALFGDANAIQFRAISSQQREQVLKAGEVDMVVRTFTVNCTRLKSINFSSVYYVAGQRVLVNEGSPAASLADLGGKPVCAAKGSTSLKNITKNSAKPVPVSVENWSDCLVMLQQGQVEAVSTDDVILAGMLEQDPTTKIVGGKFTEEPYGIGIPKQNEDMVRYVNSVLETVRNTGPWQASYDRWLTARLGPASPPPPSYK